MEHIWSPWRFTYIASPDSNQECIFCVFGRDSSAESDRLNLVIHRARYNFVVLNRFPYSSGHLMIAPYQHTGSLAEANHETTDEMMEIAKQAQAALEIEYRPEGFNIGLNLGKAAGAGVAGHLHLHVVPRWTGDANFVSVIGETRVLPEELTTTCEKLKKHF
jgi:ATP adenylyltransferase